MLTAKNMSNISYGKIGTAPQYITFDCVLKSRLVTRLV